MGWNRGALRMCLGAGFKKKISTVRFQYSSSQPIWPCWSVLAQHELPSQILLFLIREAVFPVAL